MIKTFKFKNFLSFKDEVIFSLEKQTNDDSHKNSFFKTQNNELLKSAVIYGANASGKSNFSKAFVFFYHFVITSYASALTLLNNRIPTVPFLLNNETENFPSLFEIEILNKEKKFIYGFEVSQQKIFKEWLYQYPQKKILFERKGDEIKSNKRHFKEATSSLERQTKPNVLFLTKLANDNGPISNEVIGEIKKINVYPVEEKQLILDYAFINFSKYKDFISEFLQEGDYGIKKLSLEQNEVDKEKFENFVPQQVRNIMQTPTGTGKFFQRKASSTHTKYDNDGKEVGEVVFDFMNQESSGTRQMVGLAALFANALEEKKTLFIDELDSSLHPLQCRFILNTFNSKKRNPKNSQLIFTTHDVSLLDNEILRRDQIFFVEKDKYGASKLFSLSDIGERKDLNYSKRYFEGRYGAIPYIKSLESNEEQWK